MDAPERSSTFDARVAAAVERLAQFVDARLGPRLRREVEPLDVVQDTLADAWAARERYEERGGTSVERERAFRAWLCRIAAHRIADLARGVARDRRPPEEARLAASVVLDRARASMTGPGTAAERAEASARLTAALDGLSDEDREVVLARHFEGLTLDEIAARIGRSEASVRRALGRSTVLLGAALRGLTDTEGSAR